MIAFDSVSNSGYQTAQGSYSWSHTIGPGSNRILVVGVSMLSVAGSSVSGITFGGVALTKIRSDASVSGAVRTELWYLTNPENGSGTIVVSLSASLDSASGAQSFTGVDQKEPIEANNGASATNVGAADATVGVTSLSNNAWTVDIVGTDDTAISIGTEQTSRFNLTGTLGSGAGSHEGPTPIPGVITMSWTNIAGLATWTISAACIKSMSGGVHNVSRYLKVGTGMSRSELAS